MHLTAYFAARGVPDGGPASCGLVLNHRETERPIYEAGHFLGSQIRLEAAPYLALLRLLDIAADSSPDQLELCCPHRDLIEQITTASPSGPDEIQDLHTQVMMKLLRFDHWQIKLANPEPLRRPRELAESALREACDCVDLSIESSTQQQKQQHTGVPQWIVELLEDPGADCPARCTVGRRYPFGPDLPAGFCVHAARIALEDGPLLWADTEQTRMTTMCPFCEIPMRIERVQ